MLFSQTISYNSELLKLLSFLREIDTGERTPTALEVRELSSIREIIYNNNEKPITPPVLPKAITLLTSLHTLNLKGFQVADISAIVNLCSLKNLNLSDTGISDCRPLSNLCGLNELQLSNTKITDCRPLANLTALKTLDLSGTYITDCSPLSNLTALEVLNLSSTYITDCSPLANLTALKYIYLNNTSITDFSPLSNLTALVGYLDLSNTQIADCSPLANLTALKYIYLNNTSITDCSTLSNLTALKWLDLSNTKIKNCSPLANLTSVQYLYLSNTQITDCSPLANLTALKTLDLSGTYITDCNPLSNLTALEVLNLSGTHITDCSPLANLTALKYIYLNNTSITDCSPLINLTTLADYLDLSNTQITDCSPLANLTALKTLDLSGTCITDCSPLSCLDSLKWLDLSNTQIADCSPLANLTSLQYLYLSNTQITDCSPLANLISLQELSLSNTQITDCRPLAHLIVLKKLDLSGLCLHSIPPAFHSLHIPFVNTGRYYEKGINLYNVQLRTQPISLFSQPTKIIDQYFRSEQIPINEAKVLFLGDGGAGKTHTIKRILNNGKNGYFHTQTTPGIEISSHDASYRRKTFKVNFWDFGGQEIMHAMHRCFLTERSLYVVVLSNRYDLTPRARFWLKNVQSFAKNSPVLLAVNRWDNYRSGALDMEGLQKEFPMLLPEPVFFCAIDPEPEEFQLLPIRIYREAAILDSTAMEFPKDWANIRNALLTMGKDNHYISLEDYYKLCQTYGVSSPEIRDWLLHWFNDMGICFSYHDTAKEDMDLDQYKVLQPHWVTNAVYALIQNGRDYADRGMIHINNIRDILRNPLRAVKPELTYENEDCRYILEVMRKFNLSYSIDENFEFIPALCPEETPKNLHPTDCPGCFSYKMAYSYLPDTVIHRLMILCYQKLNPSTIWRKGLRLEDFYAEMTAVVDMGRDDATLRIDIYPRGDSRPWQLLNPLRESILEINKDLGITAVDYILYTVENEEVPIPTTCLLTAINKRIETIPIFTLNGKVTQISVEDLLIETFGEEFLKVAYDIASQEKAKQPHKHLEIHEVPSPENTSSPTQRSLIEQLISFIDIVVNLNRSKESTLTQAVISVLESTGEKDAQYLAIDMKKAKKEGKNALQRLGENMKAVSNIVAAESSAYKVSPYVPILIDTMRPWLTENLLSLSEIVRSLLL